MKAVIADLDRTLLHTDKTLSEYTLNVLRRCHDKGIAIMAATARPERSILTYQKQIGFDAVTTLNGARILLPDKVIENGIAHISAKRILSKLITIADTLISVETDEGIYSNEPIPEWESNSYAGFPDLPTQGALFKILASSQSGTLYRQIKNALTDDVYYTIADTELVQIMSREATKWNGVKAMLESLHIPPQDTVYFGDDNDDIEPIRMCGLGVAVSNAVKEVRDEADSITDSNDEDGVARFIELHLL